MLIWLIFAGVCSVLVAAGGCARVPATATVPGRPATPYEQVLAWNAAIANANLAVTQGLINANRAGAVSDPDTVGMLDESARIAQINRQLTLVFQAGPDAVRSSSQVVTALISQIQSSAATLVLSGAAGIKDTQAQGAIKAQLDAIFTFTQQTLTTLRAAGLLGPLA